MPGIYASMDHRRRWWLCTLCRTFKVCHIIYLNAVLIITVLVILTIIITTFNFVLISYDRHRWTDNLLTSNEGLFPVWVLIWNISRSSIIKSMPSMLSKFLIIINDRDLVVVTLRNICLTTKFMLRDILFMFPNRTFHQWFQVNHAKN